MIFDYREIQIDNIINPVLKEYISLKMDNLDSVLFFQMGGFYETFFQDAKIMSIVTGLNIKPRTFKGVGEVAQAGMRITISDFYIKKLLSESYKVCICEEYQDEQGVYHRRAIRKYTPGTVIEDEFLEAGENNFIVAVFEYNNICYLSYSDVSTGQFYKTCGSFSDVKFEIEKIAPDELLLLDTQQEKFKDLAAKFPTTVLDKTYFVNSNIEDVILKYCKTVQKDFLIELDDVIEYKINKFLSMDEVTRHNLEMTRTRRLLKKKGSIFWFLNHAKTPMGIRLLKKYLNEPLLNVEEIEERQSAIDELVCNIGLLKNFESELENFCDLSRLCAKISNSTIKPKELFILVRNSRKLFELSKICKETKSKLLQVSHSVLDSVLNFLSAVNAALSENSASDITKGGIINDGYDANLDYLRNKLENVNLEITKYEKSLRKRFNIDNLKIGYSGTIGYYIEVPIGRQHLFPCDFVKKQTLSKCIRLGCATLREFEDLVGNLKFQIYELEYALFCEIRAGAKKYVDEIRDLAKDIAKVDVLVSCARCAYDNNFKRPVFIEKGIYIKNGFHPCLLKLNNEIIKNDTRLENDTMIILTGANMSGKSTYLKHNATICVMAQMGCYVPADSAELCIVDKIFLRQGSTDDIVANNSSFMVEMCDLKFILDNATDSSLILLDEPAKSTSAKEGGAIARAYCEYLLGNYKTKAIIITHNLELTKLETRYPKRVFNYVIEAARDDSKTSRKIVRGIAKESFALNTAELAQMPGEIIELAKKYL